MAVTVSKSMRIYISPEGVIEVRTDKNFSDDSDNTTATTTKIDIYTPDMDTTAFPNRVKKIANVVWDQATIDAWKTTHPSIPIAVPQT